MPRDLVTRIHATFTQVLVDRDFVEKLRGMGFDVASPSTPEEFAARVKADVGLYSKVIRDAKVPLID
jgi:tripartite-type tricarboxylate transporter receptor subunit TctC